MNYAQAKNFARELRKNQTEAESAFWFRVRNRFFHRLKFSRQFLISYKLIGQTDRYFIADFYCHQHKIVVEIDGGYHNHRKAYDDDRTDILKKMGLQVIRFTNEEVIDNWEYVEGKLLEFIDT